MIKKTISLFFILYSMGFSQVNTNLFFKKSVQLFSTEIDPAMSYTLHLDNMLLNSSADDSFRVGLDLNGMYQNSATTPYNNYNDKSRYMLSPFFFYRFNPEITFNIRINIENIRDEYLYPQRTYFSKDWSGHRGGFSPP